jgi:hypothetical protein
MSFRLSARAERARVAAYEQAGGGARWRAMTADEKRALAEGVQALSDDALRDVVDVVRCHLQFAPTPEPTRKRGVAAVAAEDDAAAAELDLDRLDTMTLRHLQVLVEFHGK